MTITSVPSSRDIWLISTAYYSKASSKTSSPPNGLLSLAYPSRVDVVALLWVEICSTVLSVQEDSHINKALQASCTEFFPTIQPKLLLVQPFLLCYHLIPGRRD